MPADPGRARSGRLERLNRADAAGVRAELLALTAAPHWADELVAGRPYAGIDDVLTRSDEILAGIGADQIDAALAAHPRIGEPPADLDAGAAARSTREQAGMADADADLAAALARANADYEERFGRIYLVSAAGLSAQDLLVRAQGRLSNEPAAELEVVRDELARISRLRLTEHLT